MKSWGLVLAGGAAHGIANAGVVEVLHEAKLRPDYIAGSSMGAIIGALTALGHPPATIREICESLTLRSVARLSDSPLRGGRLHSGLLQQNLHTHLSQLVGTKHIRDCQIPFLCIAGRIKEPIAWHRIIRNDFSTYIQGCFEPYVFPPETPLLDALLASSAIPVLFSPAKVGSDEFIDMISFGAVPARALQDAYHPDLLIATDTNPRYDQLKKFLPPGWRQFIEDGNATMDDNLACCDLVIKPTLSGSPFRFDMAMEFYKAGRSAAEKLLPQIKAAIAKHT